VTMCEVSLVEQHKSRLSQGRCILGKNFGCTDHVGSAMEATRAEQLWLGARETAVWIGAGCRGRFRCNGMDVTCGFPGWRDPSGRHNCTCSGRKVDGESAELPPDLAATRLTDAKRMGSPRFVPATPTERLSAVYTFWNLLDAVMQDEAPDSDYATGYVREVQMRRMMALVQAARPGAPRVTYCEIGTNGGHSSAAMLLADPRVTVHAFDLLAWAYSQRVVELLKTVFGERFQMHNGSSFRTVPAWTEVQHASCDVLLVDGDHSLKGAMKDLYHFEAAAANKAVLVVDDIQMDPGSALRRLASHGRVRVREVYGPYDAPSPLNPCMRGGFGKQNCMTWGFAVAQYTTVSERQNATQGAPRHPARQRQRRPGMARGDSRRTSEEE